MKPKYWNKGKLYLSNNDRVLKGIINKFPKESLLLNSNNYHSLINSIIGQQISVSAANAIKLKFFKLHKNILPKNVLNFEEDLLRECGLSRQKILYIKNISNFFINNKNFFKKINTYKEIDIKTKLISIKGVGNWTADMFLLFSYGSSDIFPQGDLGFIKAISKSYKKELPLSEAYLKKLQKKWSPYNSIATWYLWRSLDPIPVSY
jgi:DNA-3-methyladenine glycosylase II|tara:strand:- start:284 stop:901 length:618 start_codon:yes stop_codon:yes gene_type:complete